MPGASEHQGDGIGVVIVGGPNRLLTDTLAATVASDRRVSLQCEPVDPADATEALVSAWSSVVIVNGVGMAIYAVSDLVGRLVASLPLAHVLVVSSVRGRERCLVACVEAGATGVIDTGVSGEHLIGFIERAARGESLVDAEQYLRSVRTVAREREDERMLLERLGRLTPRELEILRCLNDALSTAEIAQRFRISTRTVDTHVSRLLHKLGVHSRIAAITVAGRYLPPETSTGRLGATAS